MPASTPNKNPQPPSQNSDKSTDPKSRLPGILFWAILIGLLIFGYLNTEQTYTSATQINYSQFKNYVNEGRVSQVEIQGNYLTGNFKDKMLIINPRGDSTVTQAFNTYLPDFGNDDLINQLEKQKVEVTIKPESDSSWWTILIYLLPFLFLIFIVFMFFQRVQSQGSNIFSYGQSQAKLYDQTKERVTFDDVAGVEGAKTELQEIIGFLKEPERFQRLGGEVPKGILLVGPPGTGKTLLARAVAGEAIVPFFSITGSDFMEMFVGVGAKRVREMFKNAKAKAPSIIFIDELDSIGRQRGAGLGGGHDEREQTLNQLLSELDGFEANENVIVMAATNRPDILDKALLRPGRFDRQIVVDLPSQEHRLKILKLHARKKKMAPDIDFGSLARSTPGFSGADLKNLLNEAALLATRKKQNSITQQDIEEAKDKIIMGLVREGMALTEDDKKLLAYHEGGHAIVAAVLPHSDPLHKVSIIPRGRAMGVTIQLPEKEKYIYMKEYMLDRLAVIMGGRAAEALIYNTSTSGAENDLKQVRKLARRMVLDWGMSEKFSHMALGSEDQEVFLGRDITHMREYSEQTAREVDEEIRKIVEDSYNIAFDTLKKYRNKLDTLADRLVEKEEISGHEVLEILGKSQQKLLINSDKGNNQLKPLRPASS